MLGTPCRLLAIDNYLTLQNTFDSFLNSIAGGKVDAEIIISGSSRALVHYDPIVIAETSGYSTYNIALNASRIDLQLAWL